MIYLVKPEHRAPAVPARLDPDPGLPRVCVIGAGSSGIAAAKALYMARVPFDCFEMGSVVGGNWVFNNPNGQSACYRSLEINTSCPRMAFSDFPMPDYYPDYARHWEVRDYFERYVDHFRFRHTISFDTKVEHVHRRLADGVFEVTTSGAGGAGAGAGAGAARGMATEGPGGTETREYDAVMVCNGHHWDACWPDPPYPGEFAGRQIHAHDYRNPDELEGHEVIVVGAGNSAMDIAVDSSYVSRGTYLSVRRAQWLFPKFSGGKPTDQRVLPSWVPWEVRRRVIEAIVRRSGDPSAIGLPEPDHLPGQSHPVQGDRLFDRVRDGRIVPKPAIERLDGDGVVFSDGSRVSADMIVWATGYRVSFPFFDPGFVSAPGNELPLWKRVVKPDVPGLFFIGLLQPLGAVMPLAEAQSAWVAELLTGRYRPPSTQRMGRKMAGEHRQMERRFYRSARHTMEVDFDNYLVDLGRERRRGAKRAARADNRPPIPARANAPTKAPADAPANPPANPPSDAPPNPPADAPGPQTGRAAAAA